MEGQAVPGVCSWDRVRDHEGDEVGRGRRRGHGGKVVGGGEQPGETGTGRGEALPPGRGGQSWRPRPAACPRPATSLRNGAAHQPDHAAATGDNVRVSWSKARPTGPLCSAGGVVSLAVAEAGQAQKPAHRLPPLCPRGPQPLPVPCF